MKEIKAIIQPFRLDAVLDALRCIEGVPGAIVSDARGISISSDRYEQVAKIKLELLVPDPLVEAIVEAIRLAAHTGTPGDGRIVVIPISNTVNIRTGESEKAP